MASTFINATPRTAIDAKRYQGILITESFAQIQSTITRQLSQRHALLFAEPMHDHAGSSVDWYTEAQGTAVPLLSLPDEQQNTLRATVQELATDIMQLADSMAENTEGTQQIRGNILRLALHYPGLEYIYAVGDQPIITGWGFDPSSAENKPQDLVRLGHITRTTPAPASNAAQSVTEVASEATIVNEIPIAATKGLGLWSILRAMLLGFLFLLATYFLAGLLFSPAGCMPIAALSGCSFSTHPLHTGCANMPEIPGLGGCAKMPDIPGLGGCAKIPDIPKIELPTMPELPSDEEQAALLAEQERELALRKDIDALRLLLAQKAALCPPAEEMTPPTGELPLPSGELAPPAGELPSPMGELPSPMGELPPSLADLMPQTPEPAPIPEPDPTPAPKPEAAPKPESAPKPEPKPQKQAKGEDMRIPEDAKKNNDLSFLEGCWDSETGLFSTKTGEPLKVQYCFDKKGGGRRIINMQESKDRCAGPVRASFNNKGVLYIDADGASCSKGGGFYGHRVECSPGANNKAACSGKENGGKRNAWKARFRRG